MTDTKRKPQEFWIREPQGPFDMKVYGKDWKDHCMPSDVVYHVIEKSVYDELKAKHERVLLALKTIASGWVCSACSCSCHEEAIKVLQELKK